MMSPVSTTPQMQMNTNRLPLEHLVEELAQMGFSRETSRAEVRRMHESGQPVELNTVIDRLMNR